MKNGQNEILHYDSDKIRTVFQNNSEWASFKDICRACILDARFESKKLQSASFSSDKIRIQGSEIWVETSIVSAWLKMAEIVINTEEYDIAQSIINRFDKTEKPFSLPDISTIDGQIQMVKMYALQLEERKRLDAVLAIAGPKAEKYDQLISVTDNGYGVQKVYDSLGIKYFTKITDFTQYLHDVLKWTKEQRGFQNKIYREGTKQAIIDGYVFSKLGEPDSTGRCHMQFYISQKGFDFLVDHFAMKFSQKKLGGN